MVSKNQLKQILKLKHKKYRTRLGFFVAEGEKIVNDLINCSWHAQSLYSLEDNFHPMLLFVYLMGHYSFLAILASNIFSHT